MSIVTKSIAILGMIIGIGVVTLPINHAASAADTDTTSVSVTVSQLLELSASSDSLTIDSLAVNSSAASDTATVSVIQNIGNYTVTVKAQKSVSDDTRTTVLTGPDTIAAGDANGSGARWCVGVAQNSGSDTSFATTPYSACKAVTSEEDGDVVATHTTGVGTDILDVNFQVWSAPNQVAGDYTAALVFTVSP